jgi:hypothetical protein
VLSLPGRWLELWVVGGASGGDGGSDIAALDYDAGTWHAELMALYA